MEALDHLLEQLCQGDAASAEQVFLTYEPYLRLVVRRMLPQPLRSKFDSLDVVQSIWADVLVGFREEGWQFSNAAQLKAFLVKVTRNRFFDRVRQQRVPLERQQSMDCLKQEVSHASDQVDPSELAQAAELWERMLSLCPVHHQPLLELRRQGCTMDDIAARTGFHAGSIRRIFYDLAKRLALNCDAC